MDPLALDRCAGSLVSHRIAAEHKDFVVGAVKLLRRELREIEILANRAEEFLNARSPAKLAERWKVASAAYNSQEISGVTALTILPISPRPKAS